MSINTYVLKVTNSCNLSCSYCYVYNQGDSTYQRESIKMSPETISTVLKKIFNYSQDNDIDSIYLIFHGGEPLILGKKFYLDFINQLEILNTHSIKVNLLLQTNGTLLTDDYCQFFKQHGISVGISFDGNESGNSERRYKTNGKSAYASIIQGMYTFKKTNNRLDLLCVINQNEDPKEIYENLVKLEVDFIDFLLPDICYDTVKKEDRIDQIGNWLISMYKLWRVDKRDKKTEIRLFTTIMQRILGIDECSNELFGKGEIGVLNIKSNGDLDLVDSLKICGNGFTKTGLNIVENNIQDIFLNKYFDLYYNAHSDKNLHITCKECNINYVCGGGRLCTRYSKENEFNNPSIYCSQIYKLVSVIQNDIYSRLPQNLIKEYNLSKME